MEIEASQSQNQTRAELQHLEVELEKKKQLLEDQKVLTELRKAEVELHTLENGRCWANPITGDITCCANGEDSARKFTKKTSFSVATNPVTGDVTCYASGEEGARNSVKSSCHFIPASSTDVNPRTRRLQHLQSSEVLQ